MVASLNVLTNNPDPSVGSPSFAPSTCGPNTCGNGLEKIYPTCAVRYGHMNFIGEFRYAQGMLFGCGQKVIIQTERGIEVGQMVSLTCSGCDKSVKRSTMMEYVKNSGPDFLRPKSGRILRSATVQDMDEERRINKDAEMRLLRAKTLARERELPMKFVACEHLFGGERVIFHFMSENRVDFRDLVHELAHEYHTRIEMHQVGARDEARLVADYEICGRECCCKNFLKTLRPVTMRMAKLQKATLDPSKVSGRCGRLRCCLRYEHEGYEEMNAKLPRAGTRVETDKGVGTVKDRQVLTQLLMIEYDADGTIETVGFEMTKVLDRDSAPPPPQRSEPEMRQRGDAPPDRSQGRRDNRPRQDRPAPVQPPREADATPPTDHDTSNSQPQSDAQPDGQRDRNRRRRRRGGRGGGRGPQGPSGPPSGDGRPPSPPAS
ncbi:MAG: regulatory iron-sulfur-containing complex subunit RicT [Planctomycetota bacterium]